MFKAEYNGRPRPTERSRARFSKNNRTFYLYNPPSYQKYKAKLIKFFNQFSTDEDLIDLFNPKKIIYGLSIKVIFRLNSKGMKPFYTLRPDIDNLFKAVLDGLFQSDVNLLIDGIQTDKAGVPITDIEGNPLPKYKQRIDDSRVVHIEVLKVRVNTADQEGFAITIRNVGKEEIQ